VCTLAGEKIRAGFDISDQTIPLDKHRTVLYKVRFLVQEREFSGFHSVQSGSEAHSVFFTAGTGAPFPRCAAAGA
jgi:hypothetical protein